MWTEQQLREYEGDLYITREFNDAGYAFVDVLEIFIEGQEEPVYTDEFLFDGECEKFLKSIGFGEEDNGLQAGYSRPAREKCPVKEDLENNCSNCKYQDKYHLKFGECVERK